MHMADALVTPAVAGTMYAASLAAASYSVYSVRKEDDPKKIPLMGVMGAFVFAAQMINFTIPGTGSSGHLCGGMLLSALLGPSAGFLSMIAILLIQCLFFADGGLLALGCNVWNMAFYGCFIGSLVFWKPFMKNGASRLKIILASVIGSIVTLQLGAFSVVLETLISGVSELPFTAFVSVMQPIHLAIGLVEGLITAAVLIFVYETRPELLWGLPDGEKKEARMKYGVVLGILGALTLLVGGALSLFASGFPDGLEWSIERVTGSPEIEAAGSVYDTAGKIQEATSFLPDYAFKEAETAAGTTVSGIVGGLIVLAVLIAVCFLFRFFRKKKIAGKG